MLYRILCVFFAIVSYVPVLTILCTVSCFSCIQNDEKQRPFLQIDQVFQACLDLVKSALRGFLVED